MSKPILHVELIDPKTLKTHPLNQKIYGNTTDPQFIRDTERGIDEPLAVTADLVVLRGHRRLDAALFHEFDSVPCIRRTDLTDDLEQRAFLIRGNKHRDKTEHQKAQEARYLLQIEGELAARRQKTGKSTEKPDLREPVPQGRAAEIVAKEMGTSGKTVIAQVKVADAIDAAKANGDEATAKRIVETLEKKGVKPALREATAKPEPVQPPTKTPTFAEIVAEQNRVLESFARSVMAAFNDHIPTDPWFGESEIEICRNLIKSASASIRLSKAHDKPCPKCHGKGCKACRHVGYMPKRSYEGMGGQ